MMQGMRYGVARGVFCKEFGLVSSPIARAAAQTKNSVTQPLVATTQTFIDTIVMCSITGFTIIAIRKWTTGKTGAQLTTAAFTTGLPGESGGMTVALGLLLFAYSTLLGWSYYGEQSVE